MSAGNVITQIRRKQGRFDFIPAYSTDVLLQGVCHLAHVPQKEAERTTSAVPEIVREAYTARMKKSREKFEEKKEEIYMALAKGRGVKFVANQYRIGYGALQRYLEEESK